MEEGQGLPTLDMQKLWKEKAKTGQETFRLDIGGRVYWQLKVRKFSGILWGNFTMKGETRLDDVPTFHAWRMMVYEELKDKFGAKSIWMSVGDCPLCYEIKL